MRKRNAEKNRKRSSPNPNWIGSDVSFVIAKKCLEALDTALSLSVFLLMKYKEWDQIAEKAISPDDYDCLEKFRRDYLAVGILRKHDGLPTSFDRTEVALRNFQLVEKDVGAFNRQVIQARWFPEGNLALSNTISSVARVIHSVIGDAPPTSTLEDKLSFGPGASSSCRRADGHAFGKSRSRLDVTDDLLPLAPSIVGAIHPWASAYLDADGPCSLLMGEFRTIGGARVECVPKDAKTHRVIAVEPHVNIVLQRALGFCLEQKLRSVGINLHNQRRNQLLAEKGFKYGFATIDLSNASDSLSLELMRDVLPPLWFRALDLARSKRVKLKGKWHRLEKFSTAGCGFTFALETLVFYAICVVASGERPKAVYGDDIIVRDEHFDVTIERLKLLGFTPNQRKSFCNSPFRESCGEDFFRGVGVRPFFIRGSCKSLSERISLHNQIFRYSLRYNSGNGRAPLFEPLLRFLRGKSRLLVPYDLGDAGFAASKQEGRKNLVIKDWVPTVNALLGRPGRRRIDTFYGALIQSFFNTPGGGATLGFHPTPSIRWHVSAIPILGWTATDTFEISSVSAA